MHNKYFWDISYSKKDNFLLYPNEEVIRFFNKYIYRKVNFKISKKNKVVLDIGCGSGRHLLYCLENGYFPIGIDLSKVALEQAKSYLSKKKYKIDKNYKLICSNSKNIELKTCSIDYVISHGTLDSMPTEDILNSVEEIFRVMKFGSLGYVDLISDKVKREGKFLNKYDQLIIERHEKNTVQSYFNLGRIKQILKKFKIINIYRMDKLINNKIINARYSVVFKKI